MELQSWLLSSRMVKASLEKILSTLQRSYKDLLDSRVQVETRPPVTKAFGQKYTTDRQVLIDEYCRFLGHYAD